MLSRSQLSCNVAFPYLKMTAENNDFYSIFVKCALRKSDITQVLCEFNLDNAHDHSEEQLSPYILAQYEKCQNCRINRVTITSRFSVLGETDIRKYLTRSDTSDEFSKIIRQYTQVVKLVYSVRSCEINR